MAAITRCLILLVLLLPAIASGEGDLWALLVGIDEYEAFGIAPLHFAAEDAQRFAEVLLDVTSDQRVWVMTDQMSGEDRPTNTNVLFRLQQLMARVGPEDTLVFFFSGHSISRHGQHYLLSVNADIRTLQTLAMSSIPVSALRRLLRQCNARQVVLLLDGCRNDPEAGKGEGDNPLTESFLRDLMLAEEPVVSRERGRPGQSFAVLFASSVGERAYEWPEQKQGVFSFYLIRGFRGEATEPDGSVTVTSLARYLRQRVTAWSREHLPPGRTQTPWLEMRAQTPIVLRRMDSPPTTSQSPPSPPALPPRLPAIEEPEMVLIPAGACRLGSDDGPRDEQPAHLLDIPAFYMDRTEVTNAQYARFLNSLDASEVPRTIGIGRPDCLIEKRDGRYVPRRGFEQHPVVTVSWHGADAYARWAEKRLPTEAEWEKAARGGLTGMPFPNGAEMTPAIANFDEQDSRGWRFADLAKYLQPVSSYPPNGYGLYDMAGNVWEWCADWYAPDAYQHLSLTGPPQGTQKVLRGGSWSDGLPYLRVSYRYFEQPHKMFNNVGFRCVR